MGGATITSMHITTEYVKPIPNFHLSCNLPIHLQYSIYIVVCKIRGLANENISGIPYEKKRILVNRVKKMNHSIFTYTLVVQP